MHPKNMLENLLLIINISTNVVVMGKKAKGLGLGQTKSPWEQCSVCTILSALCHDAHMPPPPLDISNNSVNIDIKNFNYNILSKL